MRIEFNAYELQFLAMTAERRQCVKLVSPNERHGIDKSRSDFSLHVHGVAGEMAVARLLGVKIDTSVSLTGDDGHDLLYNGQTLQVKTNSSNKTPYFYVPEKEKFISKVGVLTKPASMASVDILGWIPRERFMLTCEPVNFGYRTNYGVRAETLDSPETLKAYLDSL